LSIAGASLPVFEIGRIAPSGLLDQAKAHAGTRQIGPAVLFNARLLPDMFALTREAQTVCDLAKSGGARLAGLEAPKSEDNGRTLADLCARAGKTLVLVKRFDAEAMDAAGERETAVPLRRQSAAHMRGADYLDHLRPNFDVHRPTVSGIVRQSGVEVGKRTISVPSR
jgi:hypothetical protein